MIKLRTGEKIAKTVRKHWFIFFAEAISLVILALAPLILFAGFFNETVRETLSINASLAPLFLAGYAIWLLFLWITFFVIWTHLFLDILIVTNKRVIDVEQRGFFSREIATLPFDRIQDITVEVNGLLATVLGFGTLHIQTAGQEREFTVQGIKKPHNVKDAILKVMAGMKS